MNANQFKNQIKQLSVDQLKDKLKQLRSQSASSAYGYSKNIRQLRLVIAQLKVKVL